AREPASTPEFFSIHSTVVSPEKAKNRLSFGGAESSQPPTPKSAEVEKAEALCSDIELFVCERYRIPSGWSSSYLLPTDRHAFRARGCNAAWQSPAEAEEFLLAPGWSWADPCEGETEQAYGCGWQVNPADGSGVDGWSYGVNFTSSFE
ncbi:unnamed protein product, partial [Polarella glacialis]